MKKARFAPIFVLLLTLAATPWAPAAPYGPTGRATTYTQPNGKSIELRMFGDEYYARTETAAGYTVVFDSETRTYFYATPSADQSDLVSTGVAADLAPPASVAKHADISANAVHEARLSRVTQADRDRLKRWQARTQAKQVLRNAGNGPRLSPEAAAEARANAAPLNGNVVGLTLLVQFRDVKFKVSSTKVTNLLNQVGYPEDGHTGSVRDYFFDQSNGQLTYTQIVPAVITLVGNRNEYNRGDAGQAGRKLLTEALDILVNERGFDPSGLTVDADNNVLATNVFFAGEDSGVWAQGLWPHQWNLEDPYDLGGGKFSYKYQITNIPGNEPTIGTFCHESGHLITDFPDLYDYGGESEGVGQHCLMGSGSFNGAEKTPAPINLYFKDMLGWANLTDTEAVRARRFELPSTGNVGVRVVNPDNEAEAFYIENRGPGDKWANACPDKGLVIWHTDNNTTGNDFEQRTEFFHYQVSLEQADSRFDLENGFNRGDAFDLFDLISPFFSENSIPNSNWWSGEPSNVNIKVLDNPAPVVRFDFGEVETDVIKVLSPNGGEVWFHGDTRDVDWVAGINESVQVDLLRDDVVVMPLATNTQNDGNFEWTIPGSLLPGENYRVRVRSTTRAEITDLSDSFFTIKAERDLADAVDLTSTDWTTSGDADWFPQTVESYDGEDAAQCGPLSDGQSSSITTQIEGPCLLSFQWKVSSLAAVDFLSVEVEGKPEIQVPLPISGLSGWELGGIELPEGTHTIIWTLNRGTSTDIVSAKSAWLDQVTVTPRLPLMEVRDMFGNAQPDGNSTLGLGQAVALGEPLTHTLTVHNLGEANLNNISVSIEGANHPGFSVSPNTLPNLAPGESAPIEVTFVPQIGGSNTAVLTLLSSDESTSPYTVNLISEVTSPTIRVVHATNILENNKGISLGTAYVGIPKTTTFEIRNVGQAPLFDVEFVVTSPNGATMTMDPPSIESIFQNNAAKVTLTLETNVAGPLSGSISIISNDLDNSPFLIPVSATGAVKPDLALQVLKDGGTSEISDALNFGSQPLDGGSETVTLRVWNRGSKILRDLSLTKSGIHSREYSLKGSLPAQLAPGDFADVKLTFSPKAAGYREADLMVKSDDPQNPTRKVNMFGDGRLLPDSSLTLSTRSGKTISGTNGSIPFGKVPVEKNSVTKKLVLKNTGLSKISDIETTLLGPNASDFRIVGFSTESMMAGEKATLSVRFNPSSLGPKQARLRIRSNDPVQPVMLIDLSGKGIKNGGPDITVKTSEGRQFRDGSSTYRFNAVSRRTLRGVIKNDGDLALTKISLSVAGKQAKHFRVLKPKKQKLNPGESTDFEVRYDAPKTASSKATLKIRSNDEDENPFDLRLRVASE